MLCMYIFFETIRIFVNPKANNFFNIIFFKDVSKKLQNFGFTIRILMIFDNLMGSNNAIMR